MARIGVEPSLTDVKDALMEMGHEVIDLHGEDDAENCDCCIISGLDKDMMGYSNTVIQGPVINTKGMDAESVLQEVNERLS